MVLQNVEHNRGKRDKISDAECFKNKSGVITTEGILSRVQPIILNIHVKEKSFDNPIFLIFNIIRNIKQGKNNTGSNSDYVNCITDIHFSKLNDGVFLCEIIIRQIV